MTAVTGFREGTQAVIGVPLSRIGVCLITEVIAVLFHPFSSEPKLTASIENGGAGPGSILFYFGNAALQVAVPGELFQDV